ncbi:MAG: hypothetical protein FD130_2067, partial [Halothiobacillaceae bacterium]
EQQRHLKKLRQTALEGMTFFEQFQPCLVGSLLSGSAGLYTEIHLHLFADYSEEVNLYLLDKHIDHEVVQQRYFINGETALTVSVYRFMADDIVIEASVFPQVTRRQTVHIR